MPWVSTYKHSNFLTSSTNFLVHRGLTFKDFRFLDKRSRRVAVCGQRATTSSEYAAATTSLGETDCDSAVADEVVTFADGVAFSHQCSMRGVTNHERWRGVRACAFASSFTRSFTCTRYGTRSNFGTFTTWSSFVCFVRDTFAKTSFHQLAILNCSVTSSSSLLRLYNLF